VIYADSSVGANLLPSAHRVAFKATLNDPDRSALMDRLPADHVAVIESGHIIHCKRFRAQLQEEWLQRVGGRS
jgi:hypothetical protein